MVTFLVVLLVIFAIQVSLYLTLKYFIAKGEKWTIDHALTIGFCSFTIILGFVLIGMCLKEASLAWYNENKNRESKW